MLLDDGHRYPTQKIRVLRLPDTITSLFTKPPGLLELDWPPKQFTYFDLYLKKIGCRSLLIEQHYIDRDYVDDMALFYARSLRGYPNHCQRIHFFAHDISEQAWLRSLKRANAGEKDAVTNELQESYLGFLVVRPLPGTPIGRTVLKTYPEQSDNGHRRLFTATREYRVHVAGFRLSVHGLAFQQQDQGVSACATTALWSAIQRVAPLEGLPIATPAEITEGASRFNLFEGRSLPSTGLHVQQISEAIREAGLAPLIIRSVGLEEDQAQLFGYLSSGFPVVLALNKIQDSVGHAICAVGMKVGKPTKNMTGVQFSDEASSILAVYAHDDRLGPYACVELDTLASKKTPGTRVTINWPNRKPVPHERHRLMSMIVPLPVKLRLTITRIRTMLGLDLMGATGMLLPRVKAPFSLACQFTRAGEYLEAAHSYGLTDDGFHALVAETTLPRYLGLVRVSAGTRVLFDVLVDSTETQPSPIVGFVSRHPLRDDDRARMAKYAEKLGTKLIA